MKINIIDAALCTLLVWLLCPRIGIYGYIVTVYLAEVMNASLSLWKLTKVTGFRADTVNMLAKPALCAVGTMGIMRLLGAGMLFHGWGGLICMSMLTGLVFVILLLCLGAAELPPSNKKQALGRISASEHHSVG